MKLSGTSRVLFGLAMVFYAIAWTKAACVVAVVGIVFEIFMHVPGFADSSDQKSVPLDTAAKENDVKS